MTQQEEEAAIDERPIRGIGVLRQGTQGERGRLQAPGRAPAVKRSVALNVPVGAVVLRAREGAQSRDRGRGRRRVAALAREQGVGRDEVRVVDRRRARRQPGAGLFERGDAPVVIGSGSQKGERDEGGRLCGGGL